MDETVIIDHRYFYFRDAKRRPMVTLALARRADGAVGYGWSVCRAHEWPTYHRFTTIYGDLQLSGRELALGRAITALTPRGVQIAEGVFRYHRPLQRPEALRMIEACQANALLALAWHDTTAALPLTMQPPAERPAHYESSKVPGVD